MEISLKQSVAKIVKDSLDEADAIWETVSPLIKFSAESVESLPSRIPGHSFVLTGVPQVDNFIAVAVDLRDSTKHLQQLGPARSGVPQQLERVFYETSALLPAAAYVIDHHKGRTTEYPGDGVLGLFRVDTGEPSEAVYASYHAAQDTLSALQEIINPELRCRYELPDIQIGIGLAYSEAIVTTVGHQGFRQAKAIGRCVYCAAKLCKSSNLMYIDKPLKELWPKCSGGPLRFKPHKVGDLDAFEVVANVQPSRN